MKRFVSFSSPAWLADVLGEQLFSERSSRASEVHSQKHEHLYHIQV